MIINRVWSMPNKWTFKIPVIDHLIRRYAKDGRGWADPFAGQSQFAEYRNDLNPASNQPSQCEAITFLEGISITLNGALFDPPYSLTQVSRSYKDMGFTYHNAENPTGGYPKVRDKIADLVRMDGYVISFGWNTVGIGKCRGFEIIEIMIVSHGGNRNDTLCTVKKKVKVRDVINP